MTPDAYQCPEPAVCTSDHRHHCANHGCARENQAMQPLGYSGYCRECDPRNLPSAVDTNANTGLTPWALANIGRNVGYQTPDRPTEGQN